MGHSVVPLSELVPEALLVGGFVKPPTLCPSASSAVCPELLEGPKAPKNFLAQTDLHRRRQRNFLIG